jgi:hypothetical protein
MTQSPATSRSSHVLEVCFWGYRERTKIKNPTNCRGFSHDFDSVPGSHLMKKF